MIKIKQDRKKVEEGISKLLDELSLNYSPEQIENFLNSGLSELRLISYMLTDQNHHQDAGFFRALFNLPNEF